MVTMLIVIPLTIAVSHVPTTLPTVDLTIMDSNGQSTLSPSVSKQYYPSYYQDDTPYQTRYKEPTSYWIPAPSIGNHDLTLYPTVYGESSTTSPSFSDDRLRSHPSPKYHGETPNPYFVNIDHDHSRAHRSHTKLTQPPSYRDTNYRQYQKSEIDYTSYPSTYEELTTYPTIANWQYNYKK